MIEIGLRDTTKRFVGDLKEVKDKDLIVGHRNGEYDASDVIGTLFTRHQGFIHRITSAYSWILSEEEKSSIVLMSIHKAMEFYDLETTFQFNTYLGTVVRNAFRDEVKAINCETKNRDWYLNLIDTEITTEENTVSYLDNIADTKDDMGRVEMELTIETVGLTTNQYNYCELILNGSNDIPTDSEAARILGISRNSIKKIREAVFTKLNSFGVFEV